jgi:hypothetical protein
MQAWATDHLSAAAGNYSKVLQNPYSTDDMCAVNRETSMRRVLQNIC